MMANRFWLYLGVGLTAILIGFLVGASASPVAGVAVTAVFGVVAGVLGCVAGPKQPLPYLLGIIGRSLVVLSVAMATGIGLGMWVRLDLYPRATTETPSFPWDGSKPPTATDTALDWIAVAYKLRFMGYREDQIRAVYAIDVESRRNATDGGWIRVTSRLSDMLPVLGGMSGQGSATLRQEIRRPVLPTVMVDTPKPDVLPTR